MPTTLYAIDAFSLIFQVYHAIPTMTGPAGQPTNAIFGFTRDLLTILKEKRPTHLVCAMDSFGPAVRNEIYPEYKANRDEMPDDLRPQIDCIWQILEGFRIPTIAYEGWEADDVLATLSRRAVEQEMDVRIVTSDKDVRQLIGPTVQMYNVRKDRYLDEDGLSAEWGIRPDQVVDFQALVGDSVDNVPGVPLVGPKKAAALLEKFGTLEDVLEHADEAPGKKLRENLKTFAEQARVSRQLVELNQQLPLEIDWDAARCTPPDIDRLLGLFTEFGFRRFGDEIRDLAPGWAPQETEELETEVVSNAEQFVALLNAMANQTEVAAYVVRESPDDRRSPIIGWAVCWGDGQPYYLPVAGPDADGVLSVDELADGWRQLFGDSKRVLHGHNLKRQLAAMIEWDVCPALGFDAMIGGYLLDAGGRTHELDAMAQRYLGIELEDWKSLVGRGTPHDTLRTVNVSEVAARAGAAVAAIWQMCEPLEASLKGDGLWDLYWDVERQLIPILHEMEATGVSLDVAELNKQSAAVTEELTKLVSEIHELAGHEFNIDSPSQLRVVLFDELGLPEVKRTKTGPSTDQSVLEKLAADHPLPEKIIAHRRLAKLNSTYLEALPALVREGRLHAQFHQVVAATGRLSSSDPNLQNIPIRTEAGQRVRRAFIPATPDRRLVCADYSQVELRMVAHYSNDTVLQQAFLDGEDIHRVVASQVFQVDPNDVDKEQRQVAKAVNFGVIYGQSAYGLAEALKIPQSEAQEFIDGYFGKYAGVHAWLEEVIDDARRTGAVKTILGRRRRIEGVRSTRRRNLNLAERTAINTVIQGSAADLIKLAMIRAWESVHASETDAQLLLQIHDELVFECDESDVADVAQLAHDAMAGAMDLKVPLQVDLAVGKNWLDLESIDGIS